MPVNLSLLIIIVDLVMKSYKCHNYQSSPLISFKNIGICTDVAFLFHVNTDRVKPNDE